MYTCFYHSMAQEGKNIFVMSNVNMLIDTTETVREMHISGTTNVTQTAIQTNVLYAFVEKRLR